MSHAVGVALLAGLGAMLGWGFADFFAKLSVDPGARPLGAGRLASPGLPEILTATVLAAAWTVLWDQLVSGQDWLTLAGIMYLFMAAVLLVMARRSKTVLGRPRGGTLALL